MPLVVKEKRVKGIAKRPAHPTQVLEVEITDGPFDLMLRDRIASVVYLELEDAIEAVGIDVARRVWEEGEEVPVTIAVRYHDWSKE